MLVSSDRTYRFPLPHHELWEQITDVAGYRTWWPWLREFDARAFEQGEVWQCTVQPPLPYAVRFRVALDEVVEGVSVAATITGDIVGWAHLDVAALSDGSEVRLTSDLGPANALLRFVAVAARPMARFGHNWVLDTGAKQFGQRSD
jgi:hypothetical protein